MVTEKTYRFSLDKSSRKLKCPHCGQKTYVPYMDNETGAILSDEVGRCDRENNCGYHHTPAQYFKDNGIESTPVEKKEIAAEPPKPIDYISLDLVQKSMNGHEQSNFAQYVIRLFGAEVGNKLLLKYFVGRAKADQGKGNIFWRIDAKGMARTGKIMVYHENGKRNKEVNPVWAHNALRPFNHHLCFFGEHIIAEFPNKTIAITESEKTAIIASVFFPQYNWLATGGASDCKWREYSVFKVLENRNVILFPDFGYYNKRTERTCYQEWKDRAETIMQRIKCNISVSRVLENNLPESERANDYDLADLLIKTDETGIAVTDAGYPVIWDYVNKEFA
ncbi:DUF6371 domain-containing protein [Agriterribacter sp.]|uniref:DUF6371 domain-containing protein n=1 Tax=Agriterribacter sp. TaxID=2821509 RepID=UPI002CA9C6A3|nr:DUF6371 domain-containing protein [Agriterribacter sp.]HTN08852.1 DUF6371 domain-containing protein [Agriterribacter sp.]